MDDIPSWQINRTALLGEACHSVSPFSFSGASMGIEDAVTLATLFPGDMRVDEVEERLRLYREIRKPGVEKVRETAKKYARGEDSRGSIAEYIKFLSEHDAVGFAKEALEKCLDSHPRP